MRATATVMSVLLAGVLSSACARHSATPVIVPVVAPATPEPAPAPAAPTPAPAVERPALEPQPVPAPVAAAPEPPPIIDPTLEQAASLAANGQPDQSRRVYVALVNSAHPSRATIAESGKGLYRLGAYADAVEAFRNLGTFARGEEDLRYYNAVSLFETGHYDDARKELACALPYIQITSDVARYRDKIQKMTGPKAIKR